MSKYHVSIKGIEVDHYDLEDARRVGKVYQPGDSAIEHARKKLGIPGERGAKDRLQDIIEAKESLERAITQITEHMYGVGEYDE